MKLRKWRTVNAFNPVNTEGDSLALLWLSCGMSGFQWCASGRSALHCDCSRLAGGVNACGGRNTIGIISAFEKWFRCSWRICRALARSGRTDPDASEATRQYLSLRVLPRRYSWYHHRCMTACGWKRRKYHNHKPEVEVTGTVVCGHCCEWG